MTGQETDQETGARQPIINDVPAEVVLLSATIAVVSALILVGPAPVRDYLFAATVVMSGPGSEHVQQPLGRFAPYALSVFAHAGWAHLGLNLVALITFGTPVARRLRSPLAFLVLFFAGAIAGAVLETLAFPDRPTTLMGASAGVFGLVGAATRLIRGRGGRPAPLLSGAFAAGIAPWVAINVGIGLFGGASPGVVGLVAWVAHLGGLAVGSVLFSAVDRTRPSVN